jgi:hypothetical protein
MSELADILEARRKLEMTHKPPPKKPTPAEAATVSVALSLVSPWLGGTMAGMADAANEGRSVLSAISDAVMPTRAGPSKIEMFKRVGKGVYDKLLPQALQATGADRGTPDYYSPRTKEFYGDTGLTIVPGAEPKKPEILSEIFYKRAQLAKPKWSKKGVEGWSGDADQVLQIPELYDQFPQLARANIRARAVPDYGEPQGSWSEAAMTAKVNAGDRAGVKSGLMHELTHGVQGLDGQPRGTEPPFMGDTLDHMTRLGLVRKLSKEERSDLSTLLYRFHTGEALARAAQSREKLSNWEKLETIPFESVLTPQGKVADPNLYISRYQPGVVTQDELGQILRILHVQDTRRPGKSPFVQSMDVRGALGLP